MWGKNHVKSKVVIISLIIIFLLASGIISAYFAVIDSSNSNIKPAEIIPNFDEDPLEPTDEPISTGDDSRGAEAGEIKWSIKLSQDAGESMLSTPAICDLNPPAKGQGKKYLETIVACTDDHVYAVTHDGKLKWVYSDCVIDDAVTATSRQGWNLDFTPPALFSSITPVDIGGGSAPELLMGEQDGVLSLAPDGSTFWKDKGKTDGYYFSSIAVVDLEGDYAGRDADGNFIGYRDDLEILLGSDNDADAQAYVECWQANGQDVFRDQMTAAEHAFMTCSIVTAECDGWFFGDEERLEKFRETDENNNPETLFADFFCSTHDACGRIWKHKTGQAWDQYEEAARTPSGTHQTYATPVVGNFTGGPELEVINGYLPGHQWENSGGNVMMYRQDGTQVGDQFPIDDVPGAILSSPAACDAQNFDPDDLPDDQNIEYEVFVGSANGVLYCLSAKDLKEVWQYKTGDKILSSPAICNINSDDSLEVVVGSDDGKVYCFECDPKELDIDGEPHPKDDGIEDNGGENGLFDLLWVADTNEIVGASGDFALSSPVVGDIDYDGQLEVLIGDTEGTLYCISAGGKSVPGQIDWPKFHNDLNNTGFYNPGTSYGLKIDPQVIQTPEGPRKEVLRKSVKPGDSVTYNLTVTNVGSSSSFAEADRFWLRTYANVFKGGEIEENNEWPAVKLTGDKLEWSSGIEGIGEPSVVLMSFEKANITLTVTAPWSGDLSEFIQVTVEGNSSMDPFARDSILTTTSLEISLDFEVDINKEKVQDKESDLYGQKVVKVNPSDRAGVEFTVRNIGNLNDSYDLRITGQIGDWEAYFTKTDSPIFQNALELDAPIMEEQFPIEFKGSEGKVAFNIRAPADAQQSEIITLKVLATSKYSQNTNLIDNITKYDYLIVEVNPVPDLELECKEPRQYVVAGDNVTFKVEVINRGNSKVRVKIEHSQLEEGWQLFFSDALGSPFIGSDVIVDVVNDGVSEVLVSVYAPASAAAGSRQNIIIRGSTIAENELTLQSTDTCALTAIVSQFFDINVSVSPPSQHVDPGGKIRYNITVKNTGNGNDFVIITPSLLEVNWDTTFYLLNEERVTSELDYNQSITFEMEIKIPRDQLAGVYKTGINVSGLGDREIVYFDTTVNQIYNLSIFGVVHSEETSDKVLTSTIRPNPGVSPGSILNYVFEITNGGNAPDEITVEIQSMGEDWQKWEGIFLGITNTEAYMTDVSNWDFAQTLDMSPHTAPTGYLNSNPSTTLHEINLNLGVGQKVWLKVQITVPRDIPTVDAQSLRKFNVEASSTNPDGNLLDKDLEDNEVDLILEILFPDLVITSGIRHPSSMTNGDIVTVSAEVKNDGDIEAREVLVTFYVDGKEVKTQTINLLQKDSSRLIPFTWQATSGDHKLTIKVDPEDAIVERYEDNNEKEKSVNVKSADVFGEFFSNRTVCSILPLIIFAIIFAVIIVIIKKRGSFFGLKPGGGSED